MPICFILFFSENYRGGSLSCTSKQGKNGHLWSPLQAWLLSDAGTCCWRLVYCGDPVMLILTEYHWATRVLSVKTVLQSLGWTLTQGSTVVGYQFCISLCSILLFLTHIRIWGLAYQAYGVHSGLSTWSSNSWVKTSPLISIGINVRG